MEKISLEENSWNAISNQIHMLIVARGKHKQGMKGAGLG